MRWAYRLRDGTHQLATDRFAQLAEPGRLRSLLVPLAFGWQRACPPGARVAFCDLETCSPEVWADPVTGSAPAADLWNAAYGTVVEPDDNGMLRLRLAKDDGATVDWYPASTIVASGIGEAAWARLDEDRWSVSPEKARAALRNDRRCILTDHPILGALSVWRP